MPEQSARLQLWNQLLKEFRQAAYQEVSEEVYKEQTVPWSGVGNSRTGTHVRGEGPPYKAPLPPYPRETATYKLHWSETLGLYYWVRTATNQRQYCPPPIVLLHTDFTTVDYIELGHNPDTDPPEEPPDSPKEPDSPPEPTLLQPPQQGENSPIPVEQANPLVTATEPTTLVPVYTGTSAVQNTPVLGYTNPLLRQPTPRPNTPPTPPFRPPTPLFVPAQPIPVNPITGLPRALRPRAVLPPAVVRNIFSHIPSMTHQQGGAAPAL